MKQTMKSFPVWPGLDMSKRTKQIAKSTMKSTNSMPTVIASQMIKKEYAMRERIQLATQ